MSHNDWDSLWTGGKSEKGWKILLPYPLSLQVVSLKARSFMTFLTDAFWQATIHATSNYLWMNIGVV